MSAHKDAKPLGLDGWEVDGIKITKEQALKRLPKFKCRCGNVGLASELLADPDEHDNDTLYCPNCRTSAWKWR